VPTRPVYLPGYTAWELRLAHHDALADILCLGQVLASLSCGLDFTNGEELARFAAHRGNLFELNHRLHPVVAAVIFEMTALVRHDRARDLPSVIRRLETYRDQPLELNLGLDRIAPARDGASQRRQAIQLHLRDRLFDLSRRNRLLYFKPTQAHVNLTIASVPLVVDMQQHPRRPALRVGRPLSPPTSPAATRCRSRAGCASKTSPTCRARSTASCRRRGATARSTACRSCRWSSRSCAGTT
jgi:hypothetical protein